MILRLVLLQVRPWRRRRCAARPGWPLNVLWLRRHWGLGWGMMEVVRLQVVLLHAPPVSAVAHVMGIMPMLRGHRADGRRATVPHGRHAAEPQPTQLRL